MILIVTYKKDYTADFVVKTLNERKIPYFRLNCDDILKEAVKISIDTQTTLLATINSIECFDAVWFRRVSWPDIEVENLNDAAYINSEIEFFYKNLWISLNAKKWLSLPQNVYEAENKVLQLKIAQSLGFLIPKTLLTGNKDSITDFFYECDKRIIVKPIYSGEYLKTESLSGQIFTSIVTEDDLKALDESLSLPCIYQEYIDKVVEIRVTVVGNEVFAAAVDSQSKEETKIDWRKERLKFMPFELPEEVSRKCIDLVRRLGLNFGAIDLIYTSNKEFIFLEINPNGQWVWIETDTNQPIADALIRFLTEERSDYQYKPGLTEKHLETLAELDANENSREQILESKIGLLINNSGIILAVITFFIPLLYQNLSNSNYSCITRYTIVGLFVTSVVLIAIGIVIAAKGLNSSRFKYLQINADSVLKEDNLESFLADKAIFIVDQIRNNITVNNSKATILINAQKFIKIGLCFIVALSIFISIVWLIAG
jgi:glutathione synthase/RimK-type ligase-like ATP-grasp enzyme